MLYLFDIEVHTTHFKDEFSVVAKDDVDAREQALSLTAQNNGADFKHEKSYAVLYCNISMVRLISQADKRHRATLKKSRPIKRAADVCPVCDGSEVVQTIHGLERCLNPVHRQLRAEIA
jgi:hypothetical protein